MLGMTTTSDPGKTGIKDIAEALGGGIRENTLVLVEGETRTGKSVLTQHIAYGVLRSKESAVAFYSSDNNSDALQAQMESMSLDVKQDLVTDRFRVFKMGSRNVLRDAMKSLQLIINHIVALPERFRLVIVDSPSLYMSQLSPTVKVDFLQTCKELCERGRTIVLVLDTHVFESKALVRAYALSDYYLRLRSQDMVLGAGQIDTRLIKVLEVTKLGGAERWGQEGIKFEIKPRVGIQILPFVQIKV
ncbi:MAG TPA: ATPase domain-containing protein [Dehalococcoidales bacterium]|nr:ATPase domain-containing protein [Dehalococcoidales bacterium]